MSDNNNDNQNKNEEEEDLFEKLLGYFKGLFFGDNADKDDQQKVKAALEVGLRHNHENDYGFNVLNENEERFEIKGDGKVGFTAGAKNVMRNHSSDEIKNRMQKADDMRQGCSESDIFAEFQGVELDSYLNKKDRDNLAATELVDLNFVKNQGKKQGYLFFGENIGGGPAVKKQKDAKAKEERFMKETLQLERNMALAQTCEAVHKILDSGNTTTTSDNKIKKVNEFIDKLKVNPIFADSESQKLLNALKFHKDAGGLDEQGKAKAIKDKKSDVIKYGRNAAVCGKYKIKKGTINRIGNVKGGIDDQKKELDRKMGLKLTVSVDGNVKFEKSSPTSQKNCEYAHIQKEKAEAAKGLVEANRRAISYYVDNEIQAERDSNKHLFDNIKNELPVNIDDEMKKKDGMFEKAKEKIDEKRKKRKEEERKKKEEEGKKKEGKKEEEEGKKEEEEGKKEEEEGKKKEEEKEGKKKESGVPPPPPPSQSQSQSQSQSSLSSQQQPMSPPLSPPLSSSLISNFSSSSANEQAKNAAKTNPEAGGEVDSKPPENKKSM